jgi:hypothetical protein
MRKQLITLHEQPHYILRLCQIFAVGAMPVNIRLSRSGVLGGCDFWESWGSWHQGSGTPPDRENE